MSGTCIPHHDYFTDLLTGGLCIGLVISYFPQHLRIYNKKSSEGFSPWYLLLGSTSSASGMLNMVAMQWGVVRCCRVFSAGSCLEAVAGVIQLFLQWFLFTIILVLYMLYYPSHLKYAEVDVDTHDTRSPEHLKTNIRTSNWQLSITLSWVVLIHILFITFVTFFLLITNLSETQTAQVSSWATFLGVTSALLAAIQYAPQLVHTYRVKLVGALSIPMMLIQSPGAVLMVLSIALRPGTNWTSWITFAVAGIMQGSLLIMCIMWKFRQGRLGIDDFGHPVSEISSLQPPQLPVTDAIDEAIDDDLPTDSSGYVTVGEESPLLVKDPKKVGRKRWLARIFSRK